MPDKPTTLPRWADETPGNITEPSEPEKDLGFEVGNPRRHFMNWLLNLTYQWLGWLSQVAFWFTDFGPDQALPQGDLPGTGAGLGPIAAADFSARVYVGGYGVGPVASLAHTYAATSDTYWDLGRDGVWYATAVAAMASAPALAANHVRVFMVRTNGTDRTAVTDYRRSNVLFSTPLDLTSARWGDDRLDSAAEAAEVRQTTRFRASVTGYTHVHSFLSNDGTRPGAHLYVRETNADLANAPELVMVRGCTWNGTQWVADAGTPLTYSMEPLNGRVKRSRVLTASVVGTPFSDSFWTSEAGSDSNGVARQQEFDGGLVAGTGIGYDSAWESSHQARYRGDPGDLTDWALMTDFGSCSEYSSETGEFTGFNKVINADRNEDDDGWVRRLTGEDSFVLQVLGSVGLRLLRRAYDLADAWDDSTDPVDGWTIIGGAGAERRVRIPAVEGDWFAGTWNHFADWTTMHSRGVAKAVTSSAAMSVHLRDVPDGALITGAKVYLTTEDSSAGANQVQVSMFRTASDGTTFDLFSTVGGGYDVVTPHNETTVFGFVMTIDAAVDVRTLDKETYVYGVIIAGLGVSIPTVTHVEVQYTTPPMRLN